jgi:hypothetical protein
MQCTIINSVVQAYEQLLQTSYSASLLLLFIRANNVRFCTFYANLLRKNAGIFLAGYIKAPSFSALGGRSEYSPLSKEVNQPNFLPLPG